jgi:hypothetical protein
LREQQPTAMSITIHTVRTIDDPEANGRTPKIGDARYTMIFPLEDGQFLHVQMGKESVEKFREFLGSMDLDEEENLRCHQSRKLNKSQWQ